MTNKLIVTTLQNCPVPACSHLRGVLLLGDHSQCCADPRERLTESQNSRKQCALHSEINRHTRALNLLKISRRTFTLRCRTHLAHLCQVSPARGAGVQPGAAGKRSSLHGSCTRPRRSRSPQTWQVAKSKRIRRSLRVGIFLETLPHLTPGILAVDRLL